MTEQQPPFGGQPAAPPSAPPPRRGWVEPAPWQIAPPEPRPSAALRVGILATALLVLAALATVIVVLTRSSGASIEPVVSAIPVVATPTATPTPTPSPSPSRPTEPGGGQGVSVAPDLNDRTWHLPARDWAVLPPADPESPLFLAQSTPLEPLPPVTLTGCPMPATVETDQAWRDAVRQQWSCVHAAWVPVFEQLGWSTAEPEVRFYPGSGSKSECGYLTAPAFYCSAGESTVYFGGEHLDMARTWDLAINEMVNHEYGHHLQKLAGITDLKLGLPLSNENERRAELQATCLSGMLTWHNRSFEFDERNFLGWQQRLESMSVDVFHGSRESLRYWGTRGLYAEKVGDCNTWVTGADKVA